MNFNGQDLFSHVNLKFTPGNCYGVIGANGAGKSTFLRILSGDLEPSKGEVVLGEKDRMSVLKQDHFAFDQYHVLDTITLGNPRLYDLIQQKEALYAKEDFSDEDGILAAELEAEFAELDGWDLETDAGRLLQGLGLSVDLLYAPMNSLGAKEKVKVLLAQALYGKPDIILLDEPTNHLDIASKEILEEALNSYTGTVLYVSHDRYFINQTATRILDLTNQAVVNYIGDYDYYLEKKEELTEKYAPAQMSVSAPEVQETVSDNKLTWQQQKEEQARRRKQENELKKTEARIEELENRDKEIDDMLVLPDVCTNVGRCAELSREKEAIQAELEELYEKWETLA